MGGEHRCAGAGEPPGPQQAADRLAAHPRPRCVCRCPPVRRAPGRLCCHAARAGLLAHAPWARPCAQPTPFNRSDPPASSPHPLAGTGGKPELGEEAAQESHQEIATAVQGADMVRGMNSIVWKQRSVHAQHALRSSTPYHRRPFAPVPSPAPHPSVPRALARSPTRRVHAAGVCASRPASRHPSCLPRAPLPPGVHHRGHGRRHRHRRGPCGRTPQQGHGRAHRGRGHLPVFFRGPPPRRPGQRVVRLPGPWATCVPACASIRAPRPDAASAHACGACPRRPLPPTHLPTLPPSCPPGNRRH